MFAALLEKITISHLVSRHQPILKLKAYQLKGFLALLEKQPYNGTKYNTIQYSTIQYNTNSFNSFPKGLPIVHQCNSMLGKVEYPDFSRVLYIRSRLTFISGEVYEKRQ